jgi:exodeoxyribonuclease VII small subunit
MDHTVEDKDDKATGQAETSALTFEQAYRGLEEAVAALERGDLSLDQTMALYGRGVALAERCNVLLAAAELRVRRLDSGGDPGPLTAAG